MLPSTIINFYVLISSNLMFLMEAMILPTITRNIHTQTCTILFYFIFFVLGFYVLCHLYSDLIGQRDTARLSKKAVFSLHWCILSIIMKVAHLMPLANKCKIMNWKQKQFITLFYVGTGIYYLLILTWSSSRMLKVMNQDWEEKRLLFGRESNSEMTKLHAPDTCLFFVSDKKKSLLFSPNSF
jgi:hypothetical protein